MSTVTDPTNIPELPDTRNILERLKDEHVDWIKARRSGDGSRQMRDARPRMDALLDEMLLLRLEDTII